MNFRFMTVRRQAAVVVLAMAACIAVLYIKGLWPFACPIRNVLLISIDTTRADFFGCTGRQGGITPHIDALAGEGILFENVISPVPETLPSHSTMMTGTNPIFHGVHRNENYRLGASSETLAERLREEGFTTGAVIGSFVLDKIFGLDQGFDTYNDRFDEGSSSIGINERRAEEVSREAVEWLAGKGDRPFFLFLHYFDPHMTYDPPEPFASRFANSPYAGEIAYVDHCIGQVVAALKERGLYDSTLIIVTSDHGEMCGEHGELTHSFFIYQSAIRVPLIFKVPGHQGGARKTGLAGIVDIVPTVCALLGIEPPLDTQGIDLSASFGRSEMNRADSAESGAERDLFCESMTPTAFKGNPLFGLVTQDGWKYILTTRPELYNLSADPSEEHNLVGTERRRAEALRQRLEQLVGEQSRAEGTEGEVSLDANSRKRLESLGYVGGAARIDFDIEPGRDDPKDLIGYHRTASRVLALIGTKQYDEAEALCVELVAERPDLPEAWQMLGNFAMLNEDFAAAVDHSEQVLRIESNDARALYRLGYAHNRLGRIDEAKKNFSRLLAADPRHALALRDLGVLLLAEMDYAGARKHLASSVEIDPEDFLTLRSLAWILATHPDQGIRDADEALRLARKAIGLVPAPGAPLLDTLAAAHGAAGDFDRAARMARKALDVVDESNRPAYAAAIRERLALYRNSRPYLADLSSARGE